MTSLFDSCIDLVTVCHIKMNFNLMLVLSNCVTLCISAAVGNSLSAILDGKARLLFLARNEEYVITMPYAHCKGNKATGNLTGHHHHCVGIRAEMVQTPTATLRIVLRQHHKVHFGVNGLLVQ